VSRARVRVAVLDDYQHAAEASADWSVLDGKAEILTFADHLSDVDELAARLADVEVVVAMRERTAFSAALLARLPALKLLVTTGMTNAAIDLDAAAAHGVTVCGTASVASSAAEHTWALLMALLRHIPQEDADVRAGGWQQTVGVDLAGATIGLLGLGRLGQQIARYAHAFDMRILAWSQHLTAADAAEHGAELVSKDELFTRSDVVSVHLKLSPRTTGLVGAAALAQLGPQGYLVNTSRGPIVDEDAVIAALRAGSIAGAALDVFDLEPLPAGHPLRSAPRTVLSPHLGYVTRSTYAQFYGDAVADIVAWLDGAPVRVLA
jgi:phosphoglycerate dehydrogenase-like enzyme